MTGTNMANVADIKGLSKVKVLCALYAGAQVQGKRWLTDKPGELSKVAAKAVLEKRQHFDFLNGRILKVDIGGDRFYTGLYNRTNGINAAERVIDSLRHTSA